MNASNGNGNGTPASTAFTGQPHYSTMNASNGNGTPASAVSFGATTIATPMSNSAATTSAATNPHISTNKSAVVSDTNASKSKTEAARETADPPAPARTNESREFFSEDGVKLKLHKAKAAGDCGLLSILQEYDNEGEVLQMRMKLSQFVLAHSKHYQPIIEGLGQDFMRQVSEMMAMGSFIGEFEIQVYCDYSGDKVVVYSPNGTVRKFGPSEYFESAAPTGVVRYLFHNDNDHFDFFLPEVEDVPMSNGDEAVEAANGTSGGGAEEGNHGYLSTPGTNGGGNIPPLQPRNASSAKGSPIESMVESAKAAARGTVDAVRSVGVAASGTVSRMLGGGGDSGGDNEVRPQNLYDDFGTRSRGGRVRKQSKRYSPSAYN